MKKILFLAITLFVALSCSKKDDGSIMGTASANDGAIVSGITVKLYSENTELLMEAITDSEGNFAFSGLEAANYYIGATITVDGDVWDTGNTPQEFYISGEIAKEVALTLTKK